MTTIHTYIPPFSASAMPMAAKFVGNQAVAAPLNTEMAAKADAALAHGTKTHVGTSASWMSGMVELAAPRAEADVAIDALLETLAVQESEIDKKLSHDQRIFLVMVAFMVMSLDAREGHRRMADMETKISVVINEAVRAGIIKAAHVKLASSLAISAAGAAVTIGAAGVAVGAHRVMGRSASINQVGAAKSSHLAATAGGNVTTSKLATQARRGATRDAAETAMSPQLTSSRTSISAPAGQPVSKAPPEDLAIMPERHEALLRKTEHDAAFDANHHVALSHKANAVAGGRLARSQAAFTVANMIANNGGAMGDVAAAPVEAQTEESRMLFNMALDMKKRFDDSANNELSLWVFMRDFLKDALGGMNNANKTIIGGM